MCVCVCIYYMKRETLEAWLRSRLGGTCAQWVCDHDLFGSISIHFFIWVYICIFFYLSIYLYIDRGGGGGVAT